MLLLLAMEISFLVIIDLFAVRYDGGYMRLDIGDNLKAVLITFIICLTVLLALVV